MKKTNLSWVGALLVFALLLWCTAATPGKIADPSTYTCAVYSSALSLLPPVVALSLIHIFVQCVGDAHPAGLFGQRHQCGGGEDVQRAAAHRLGGVFRGDGDALSAADASL